MTWLTRLPGLACHTGNDKGQEYKQPWVPAPPWKPLDGWIIRLAGKKGGAFSRTASPPGARAF